MGRGTGVMFDIPNWPKDVPKEFYWKVKESFYKQQIKELKAAKAFHEGLDKLKANYQGVFQKIIGDDRMKQYKRLHNARLNKLRKASESKTLENLQEREALRLRYVKESRKAIEKSGVNLAKIRALRESHEKKASILFDRTLGNGKIGEAIPRPKNVDYLPPYFIDAREYDHYESENSLPNPSYNMYFNGRTGDFGSRSQIRVTNADEWDLVSCTCRSGFMVIYRNPHAGLPVLNLDLETVGLNYSGDVRDACGYSTASVWQRARLFGQVYVDGGDAYRTYYPVDLINIHRRTRQSDDSWSETPAFPGDDLSFSFVLGTPVPADRVILVCIGIQTFNGFLSNDSDIVSNIEARFLARRIGVTTTS